MAAGDLTDTTSVKQYLHILASNTASDSFLTSLITQVSARISIDCQRTFPATDYIETVNTMMRTTRYQVRNKPIIKVNSVRWGVSTAVNLTYSGSAVNASANITPDRRVLLETIDSSGVTTTTFNLTQSSLTLCSQLCTAINNATVGGFTAVLMGNAGTNDVPTRWLNSITGCTLQSTTAQFTQGLIWPGIDVFEYTIDPVYSTIGFTPLTTSDYFFMGNERSYPSPASSWPAMYQGLMIDYRGGYETIPQDINLLATQIVADIYNLSFQNRNLSSEKLADYSYSLLDPMTQRQYYADILAPYRRIAVAGGMV